MMQNVLYIPPTFFVGIDQRVFNDIQRTKIYCVSIIRLLAHPVFAPLSLSASCLYFSAFLTPVEVNDGRGERRWARSRIIRPRESLALYNHSILSGIDQKCRRLKPDISCGEEEGTLPVGFCISLKFKPRKTPFGETKNIKTLQENELFPTQWLHSLPTMLLVHKEY